MSRELPAGVRKSEAEAQRELRRRASRESVFTG
jgi:hypothetical protein